MASRAVRMAPIHSPVATTGFPVPPVRAVDLSRRVEVTPCTTAAAPPPAIMASVHFRRGDTSVSNGRSCHDTGDHGRGCCDRIQDVVQPGDVIGEYFNDRGCGEDNGGGRASDPFETWSQRKVAGPRGKIHYQEREKHPEAAGSAQADTDDDPDQCFHAIVTHPATSSWRGIPRFAG